MINRLGSYNANYEAPIMEIVNVEVEQGFSVSGVSEQMERIGNRNEDAEW